MKTLLISFLALGFALTASAQTTTNTPAPSNVKQVKTTPTLQANTPISPAAKKSGATTSAAPADKTPQVTPTNDTKRVEQPANNAPAKNINTTKDDASGIKVSTGARNNAAPQSRPTQSTEKLQQASPAPALAAPKN